MFEGHRRRGVSRCRLRLLDVFGRIIEVCQNRRAKSARGDGSIKACVALYALAHSSDLRIGQWTVPAENEAFGTVLRQMRDNLRHKVYCSSAGIRLCIFDVWLIAGRMRDCALNMDDAPFDVNILPFQPIRVSEDGSVISVWCLTPLTFKVATLPWMTASGNDIKNAGGR